VHSWVDNVGYLDFYALLSNPGSPQTQRSLREISEKNGSFFVWRYLSAKQKILSPRPWHLRGENIILGKKPVPI